MDEEQEYKEVGVYDSQDLQKRINAQCLQMEPIVRPLLTVAEKNGKSSDERGSFIVTFYKAGCVAKSEIAPERSD